MRVRAILLAAMLLAAAGLPATPARTETVVRWGAAGAPVTFDPHSGYNQTTNTFAMLRQVYEALTLVGPNQDVQPLLAESWRMLDPLTWEFELRRDATFHDGSPLTAEDVAFSLDRIQKVSPDYHTLYGSPGGVEVSGPHTVRVKTRYPEPLLPEWMQSPFIMSKAWAERNGIGDPDPLSTPTHRASYADTHADGTGPFTLERLDVGGDVVYARNPAYWAWAKWPQDIDRIVRHPVANPGEGTGLLEAGWLDLIDFVALDRAARLEVTPGIRVERTARLATFVLGFDQASPELRSSGLKGRNPFKDHRVRQAVYQAIDIGGVIQAMNGLGVPAGYPVPPGLFGYDEALDKGRLPYDPERARALLAEAGYGPFDVDLDCYATRVAPCRAIASMLDGIGIRAHVNVLDVDVLQHKIYSRASDLFIDTDAPNIDAMQPLRDLYGSTSDSNNGTGYANPALDALLDRISIEFGLIARDALIQEAWQMALADMVYVPLFHPMGVWAMRDWLEVPIDRTNSVDFRWARIKAQAAR